MVPVTVPPNVPPPVLLNVIPVEVRTPVAVPAAFCD